MEQRPKLEPTAPVEDGHVRDSHLDCILDEANRMAREAHPNASPDEIAAYAAGFMYAAEHVIQSRPPAGTPSQK